MARKVSDPHAEQQELLDCYAEPLNVVLAPNGEVRLLRESEWGAAQGRQIQRLTVSPDDRSILQTEWLVNWDDAELALGNARLLDGQFWGALRVALLWHKVAYHARVLVEAGWIVRRSAGGNTLWKFKKMRGFPAMASDNYLPAWVPPTERSEIPFLPMIGPEILPSGDVRWTLRFTGGESAPVLASAAWVDDAGFAALLERAVGADSDMLPVEFALAHPDKVAQYKREQAFSAALERVSATLAPSNKRVNLAAARNLLDVSPHTHHAYIQQSLPPTQSSNHRELTVGFNVVGEPTDSFPQWLSENLGNRKRVQLVQITRTAGKKKSRYLVGDDVTAALNGFLIGQHFTWAPWNQKPRLRGNEGGAGIILPGDIIEQYDLATGRWTRIPTPTIETILSDS